MAAAAKTPQVYSPDWATLLIDIGGGGKHVFVSQNGGHLSVFTGKVPDMDINNTAVPDVDVQHVLSVTFCGSPDWRAVALVGNDGQQLIMFAEDKRHRKKCCMRYSGPHDDCADRAAADRTAWRAIARFGKIRSVRPIDLVYKRWSAVSAAAEGCVDTRNAAAASDPNAWVRVVEAGPETSLAAILAEQYGPALVS